MLNSRSRFLDGPGVLRATAGAWRAMRGCGFQAAHFYQKMDSTLRGRPEAQAEGLLASTGAGMVFVVPAYPAQGRLTLGGAHWVGGVRLDRSEYARDPLSPATTHRVDRILDGAWSWHVRLSLVQAGPRALARTIQERRRRSPRLRFFTFDAAEEGHLACIARAGLALGCRAWAGASGLAQALARELAGGRPGAPRPGPGSGVVVAAGSISQTSLDQLAEAERQGLGTWLALRKGDYLGPRRTRPVAVAPGGRVALLSTLKRREEAWEALRLAAARGWSPQSLGRAAVSALVERAFRLRRDGWALLLTGGHTAEAYCERAGWTGLWVAGELLPGIPYGRSAGGSGSGGWVATKPGGFGRKGDLARALRLLLEGKKGR